MASSWNRKTAALLLCAWIARGVPGGVASQDAQGPPMLAVLTADGLLPLAYWSVSDWALLSWPTRDLANAIDSETLPPVPATIAAIPPNWIAPLPSFPRLWHSRFARRNQGRRGAAACPLGQRHVREHQPDGGF